MARVADIGSAEGALTFCLANHLARTNRLVVVDAFELQQSSLTDLMEKRMKETRFNIILNQHFGDAMNRARVHDMEAYDFVITNPPTDGPLSVYILWKVILMLDLKGRGELLLNEANLEKFFPYLAAMAHLCNFTILDSVSYEDITQTYFNMKAKRTSHLFMYILVVDKV